MAELKRIEEEVPTAELASAAFPAKEPEGPKLVKGQEPETREKAAAISKPMPLFSESEMADFSIAVEQGTDWFRGRTAPDCRRSRQVGSCGDAAAGGRFRQRAIRPGKAVGKRRQRVHRGPAPCLTALSFFL
jgi:hypothetical protein